MGFVSHEATWTDNDAWVDNFSNDWAVGSSPRSSMGLTGGAQTGYNWQQDCAVLGLEFDLSQADLHNTETYSPTGTPGVTLALQDKLDWYASIRGKAGVVVDSLMLYLSGGLAYANVEQTWAITDTSGPAYEEFSSGNGAWGFVGGVGAEWALSPNVSLKAEGLYMDFVNEEISRYSPAGTQVVSFDTKSSMMTGRMGINVKF